MPLWRCPHCGTPQAEASRCWVCRRSSTTCSTCRHFRRSIAAAVGYCGLDAGRAPLRGTEIRGCWEEGQGRAAHTLPVIPTAEPEGSPFDGPAIAGAAPSSATMRLRDFVPVELKRHRGPAAATPKAGSRKGRSARALEREAAERASREEPEPAIEVPASAPRSEVAWADRVTLFADGEV